MKGYRTDYTPITWAIGALEGIQDKELKEKVLNNFDEKYAIACENLYGGAWTISKALEYAFVWEDSPEGLEFWEKIHAEYKAKRQ